MVKIPSHPLMPMIRTLPLPPPPAITTKHESLRQIIAQFEMILCEIWAPPSTASFEHPPLHLAPGPGEHQSSDVILQDYKLPLPPSCSVSSLPSHPFVATCHCSLSQVRGYVNNGDEAWENYF